MNAQQQDALRILTSRGPMTSRALFDIMQDELGYWGYAGTHDQRQAAIEALSKILSKMKAENIIDGELTPQEKGRPVMLWSSSQPVVDKSDATDSCAVHPPESHGDDPIPQSAEMASDIAELDDDDFAIAHMRANSEVIGLRIIDSSKRIETSNGIEIMVMNAHAGSDGCYLRGETVIRNKAQLAQFIGAIESMLP